VDHRPGFGHSIDGRDVLSRLSPFYTPLLRSIFNQGEADSSSHSLLRFLQLAARRDLFKDALCKYWQASGVDVVLSPTGPGPAPPVGQAKYWNASLLS
jgi:Asp-tRNA(Asn)/Glu-tRNA(Gln) amidotransferase A subunit family amidase